MPDKVTWTDCHGICSNCRRRFRVSLETLEFQRKEVEEFATATNEEISLSLDFCIECAVNKTAEGEHIVPEIREVQGGFEARPNNDVWWEALVGADAKGLPQYETLLDATQWGDGNALDVAAHKYHVPVALVINRTGAWHPSADCACNLCEADQRGIQIAELSSQLFGGFLYGPAVGIYLPVEDAQKLSILLDAMLEGAPDDMLVSLIPLQAALAQHLHRLEQGAAR